MTHQETYIAQLMIERLVGTIDKEDSSYLDDLIENNYEIRAQWENLKNNFKDGESERYLETLDANEAWSSLDKNITARKRSRTVRIRRLAVAASLLVPIVLAGRFFLYNRSPIPVAKLQNSERGPKLFVNGHQAINLSPNALTTANSVSNNVKLNIGNGSLSFLPLNDQVSNTLNTLVIPETMSYELTLSDSTEVWLNSVTELKFPFVFSGGKREVWVKGEAYFKVTKNPRRPFIVHTPLTDIEVLGTEFNVNTFDSLHVTTALVKGSVNTQSPNGQNILLKPGYKAVFSKDQKFEIMAFDSNNELAWLHGIYYFQNATLKEIANVIHRWYGDTVVFNDSQAASSRFSGAIFKDKPLKEFLDHLTITSDIQYHFSDRSIQLSSH